MNSPAPETRTPIEATLVEPARPWVDPRLRNRSYHRIVLGIALAVLAASFLLQLPGDTKVELPLGNVQLPSICVWRNSTGVDCPGCGLTRSFICLAHGRPASAWKYNPAGLLLFTMLVGQLPYRGAQLWRLSHGRQEWSNRLLNSIVWIMAIAVLGQWLIRAALWLLF
ncbi:MAG: DUF2752 domain-containing protein [Planctomycetes bacterium]|nr:DUF2752 domain-containing protein [Planctomycetota bacterium]